MTLLHDMVDASAPLYGALRWDIVRARKGDASARHLTRPIRNWPRVVAIV
jgi:hypothetical protein